MSRPDKCPNCGITWNGLEIPDGLYKHNPERYGDRVAAEADAANYGWTPENKRTFSINMVGYYDMDKDRTVSYNCTNCQAEIKR